VERWAFTGVPPAEITMVHDLPILLLPQRARRWAVISAVSVANSQIATTGGAGFVMGRPKY